MAGLGKQTRGNGIARIGLAKGTLPDFNDDGEITQADVLIGRGVVKKAKGGSVKKDTHITKDGRVAKKGLYYYMNRAKKLGKSKPGKGTVSDKALKASAKTAKK
jgi:hypothetical protein